MAKNESKSAGSGDPNVTDVELVTSDGKTAGTVSNPTVTTDILLMEALAEMLKLMKILLIQMESITGQSVTEDDIED